MSRTTAALPILFSVSLLACRSGPLGPYESCLREPSAYREGRSREGFTTTQGGFWWLDWEGTGVRPSDPVLTVTLTEKDCLYSIRAEGDRQRPHRAGAGPLAGDPECARRAARAGRATIASAAGMAQRATNSFACGAPPRHPSPPSPTLIDRIQA